MEQLALKVGYEVMAREHVLNKRWSYDYGVVWQGIAQLFAQTGERKYYDYIKSGIDSFLSPDGRAIRDYTLGAYNLDLLNNGKDILYLYEKTGEEKYKNAAKLLRSQIDSQPRIPSGGFWHKQIYPHQMWLDGLYMCAPFYAHYTSLFENSEEAFSDIALQFTDVYRFTLDEKTGLCRHAYDDAKKQAWADLKTGQSPHAWGRANAWFLAAMADTLAHFPKGHKGYGQIADIFKTHAGNIWNARDKASGVWHQVLDAQERPGNYLESSCSCLFAYAMGQGAEMGVLDPVFADRAREAYGHIIRQFIAIVNGQAIVTKCCQVAGLGGSPYREGTYGYYLSEPITARDLKATGAFIQAAAMAEKKWEV